MYYKHYVFDSYWLSWQYLILNLTSVHAGEEPEPDIDVYSTFQKVSNICHNCPDYIFSRSSAFLQNVSSFFYKESVIIFLLETARFSPLPFSLLEFLHFCTDFTETSENFFSGLLVFAINF